MGDWMAYAYLREEDKQKKDTCVERLDVFFISKGKVRKRVIFRKRSRADIKDIIAKADAVVELFKLYDNFAFTISEEAVI